MLRIVKTDLGYLEGIPCGDPRITEFRGVPYAAPPVGPLRWRPPQPAEPWEGVFRAGRYAPMEVQAKIGVDEKDFYTRELNPTAAEYEQSEDCLYFNMWSPARSTEDRLPIYVWFHGGGLQAGYSYEMEFNGEHMAREGVIVVSVGYRINVFGWMAHPELTAEDPDGCHGNYCLQDILFCCEWLKKNARAFGGDPDRITLGGQSGSAFGAQALGTSPLAKGLITGIIMQSGGGLRALGYGTGCTPLKKAEETGIELLQILGVESIAEARKVPAEKLYEAYQKMGRRFDAWSPRIDGRMLPEESTQAYINGNFNDIPYLFGSTAGEGGSVFGGKVPETVDELRAIAEPIFGDRTDEFLTYCRTGTKEEIAATYKGPAFNARTLGARGFAMTQAEQGKTGYCYIFDHDIPGEDNAGPYHGSDLWFVFNNLDKCWRPFEGRHYDLARQACRYWTNFIKTGDPNGMDINGEPLPEWRPVTKDDMFVMKFTDKPGQEEGELDSAAKFRIEFELGRV